MSKFKFIGILIIYIIGVNFAMATQVLPSEIVKVTKTIDAPTTGEKGKDYFYCTNGKKCSTEDVVREYYKNKGYKAMRAEVIFWKGMFTLAFFDEIFSINTPSYSDIPLDMFHQNFYANRKEIIDEKYKFLQTTNLSEYINSQITKHENFNTRLLYDSEIDGYKNTVEYFKTPIVQDFLKRIDNKTFSKIVYHIAQNPCDNIAGTPDFIMWNDKELIFVEVKRENEKVRPVQIIWSEFLINNKIPFTIVRVKANH